MKRSYYLKRFIPCALVILVCLFTIIMATETVGFTDEQRMRLAEKAQLVGPSQILDEALYLQPWGEVLIGKSNHGYSLFECDIGALFYHKKQDRFTTFCPTELPLDFAKNYPTLPVFVFTENNSGTHAKLTARIFNFHSGEWKEHPFSAEAQRSENGYFLFELSMKQCNGDMYPDILTEMLNQHCLSWALVYGTTTLELYDDNGNLLQTFTRDYYVPESE